MRGELRPVWSEIWSESIKPLGDHQLGSPSIYCDLFVGFVPHLVTPVDYADLASVAVDAEHALERLELLTSNSFHSELGAVSCIDAVTDVCGEYSGDLAVAWLTDLRRSVTRFSLRYWVTDSGRLRISAGGVAGGLIAELEQLASHDPGIAARLIDIAESLHEAVLDPTERRIRNALREEVHLLEMLGNRHSNTQSATLGQICKELDTWPHSAVRKALESLYGFSSDYPGLRHAGNEEASIRGIDLRDLAALTTVFLGFVPYVTDALPVDAGFRSMDDVDLFLQGATFPSGAS